MKNILVPVDFSEYSINALEVATYVAKVKDLTINLLHVVEDSYTPYYNMVGVSMVEENTLMTYKNQLRNSLTEQLNELAEKTRTKGVKVETVVLSDNPYKSIIKFADDNDTELIVMGSHGYNDIEDIFIGGTSEKVIRLSSVPVLTVHQAKENFRLDKIVFASDFEEPEVEPVLRRVIDFAEIFMAELFLVRINTPSSKKSDGRRKRLDDMAKRFNLSAGAVTSYPGRTEDDGILNYAQEVGADLITMCTHGRTGLARFFRGSLAEEIAGASDIPVLTYNISKDKVLQSPQPISRPRKLRIEPSIKKDKENLGN